MKWWVTLILGGPVVLACLQNPLVLVAVAVLAVVIGGGLWLFEKALSTKL